MCAILLQDAGPGSRHGRAPNALTVCRAAYSCTHKRPFALAQFVIKLGTGRLRSTCYSIATITSDDLITA